MLDRCWVLLWWLLSTFTTGSEFRVPKDGKVQYSVKQSANTGGKHYYDISKWLPVVVGWSWGVPDECKISEVSGWVSAYELSVASAPTIPAVLFSDNDSTKWIYWLITFKVWWISACLCVWGCCWILYGLYVICNSIVYLLVIVKAIILLNYIKY